MLQYKTENFLNLSNVKLVLLSNTGFRNKFIMFVLKTALNFSPELLTEFGRNPQIILFQNLYL